MPVSWRPSTLTLPHKIAIAYGVLVLALCITGGMLMRSMFTANQTMGSVVRSSAPAVSLAYEMDVVVGDVALRVLSYLHNPEPHQRSGVMFGLSNFKVYLNRYLALASTEHERDIAEQLRSDFEAFATLGLEMMEQTSASDARARDVQEQLRQVDKLLQSRFARQMRESPALAREWLQIAYDLEGELRELSLALNLHYNDTGRASNQAIGSRLVGVESALGLMRAQMEEPEARAAYAAIAAKWRSSRDAIDEALVLKASFAGDLTKFMGMRQALDERIVRGLQDGRVEKLDSALDSVQSNQSTALLWMIGVALVSVAGSLSIYYWVSTVVRRTLVSLRTGAEKVADGTLEVRLPSSGDPDFDRVLSGFNRMAERLQATTVSKLELEESDERFRHAVRGSLAGIWDWNLVTGNFYMSPRFKEIFGFRDGECSDERAFFVDLLWPEDRDRLEQARHAHFEMHVPFDMEYRIRRSDGTVIWVRDVGQALWNAHGEVIRFSGSIANIDAQKMAEERIERMAYYDALTELPGRALFNDRLHQAVLSAEREQRLVAVLFVDLDRFKAINDNLGHQFGDVLLQQSAQRMLGCVRRGDTVARFSGDEFGAVLADIGHRDDVVRVVESFVAAFAQPYWLDGKECFVTPSIGVAVYPDDNASKLGLLRAADLAMYHAKDLGGNGYQFYTTDMHGAVQDQMEMKNDLHRAMERGEFVLYYQPIVSPQSTMLGVEALIRWQHPTKGLVPPVQFIPLAEETGMIVTIGEWVLKTACAQVVQWQSQGHPELRLAVNVSPRQLRQVGMADMVARVLQETGLPGETLEIEITEGILAKDDASTSTLRAVSALGVRLSVDDFGTGYSSLTYLKRFPIDTLKIDQFFVRGLPGNSEDGAMVVAIISMARSLGLHLVAEGVEAAEQLEFLRSHGVEAYQGYHFSRPVPADELEALLEEPQLPSRPV